MEIKIVNDIKSILNAENVRIVRRLLGGMSNYTYVVECDGKLFTFREPGDYAQHFVDRVIEKENIILVESLGITNTTIYLNVENGQKIAEYIEGISLNQIEPDQYPLTKIAQTLKKIHQSGLQAANQYDPLKRLDRYERYIQELQFHHPEEYYDLKKMFLRFVPVMDKFPKVLCHGDSQPSNFILSNDTIWVVDFEFCGNNDPIYDIACFSNMRIDDGLRLLNSYYDDLSWEEFFRFYAWRGFQCLQWFNVATFKQLNGMSEKLHIDFQKVAINYLEKAAIFLNEAEKNLRKRSRYTLQK